VRASHYSAETGHKTDIYGLPSLDRIQQIAQDYSQTGRFFAFGYRHGGRFRAAIKRYVEFLAEVGTVSGTDAIESSPAVLAAPQRATESAELSPSTQPSNDRNDDEIEYRQGLFEQKFVRKSSEECWPWRAGTTSLGHGVFGMGSLCNGPKPAHVAAWFFYQDREFNLDGPYRFHHLCHLRSCVNPLHLAIFGPKGLENDETVLQFIANRASMRARRTRKPVKPAHAA
jgi:hypothetical protein